MVNSNFYGNGYIFRIAFKFFIGIPASVFSSFITWVSIFAVSIGVAVIVVVLAVINGFEKEVANHIVGATGHAIFLHKSSARDWQQSYQVLKKDHIVESTIPFISGDALVSYRDKTFPVHVEGFQYDEQQNYPIIQYLGIQEFDKLSTRGNEVFLGSNLAERLGVVKGERLTLLAPRWSKDNKNMNILSSSIKVRDTFSAGLHDIDNQMLLTTLEVSRKLLEPDNPITGFRTTFDKSGYSKDQTRRLLKKLGEGFEALHWTQFNRNFFLALKSQKRILFLILSLVIAIAMFNIAAAILLIVEEKKPEIFVLHTIGCSQSAITSIFLIVGSLVSSAGTLLGFTIGYLLTQSLNPTIKFLESVFSVTLLNPAIYYIDYLPIDIRATDLILTFITATLLCLFASAIPAYKASTEPLKLLR